MSNSDKEQRNIPHESVIRIGAGFAAKEHSHVVGTLSALGPHLGRWGSRDVKVDVSLQDRGGKEQRVTLRTSLPGLTPLVAVAENPDITRALGDAKRELIRQLGRQKSARDPMNNRRSSATIRHPGSSVTPRDIVGAGVRRRLRRREMLAAQSTWDSEGGATEETESLTNGVECRPPRGLGG
jgi:ribosome-associated translation inhibitor RaiA